MEENIADSRFLSVWKVEREYISYVHDGSDTLCDNFTIEANQTEIMKHSLPVTAKISIVPVNDQTPVVTANRPLKVRRCKETDALAIE